MLHHASVSNSVTKYVRFLLQGTVTMFYQQAAYVYSLIRGTTFNFHNLCTAHH